MLYQQIASNKRKTCRYCVVHGALRCSGYQVDITPQECGCWGRIAHGGLYSMMMIASTTNVVMQVMPEKLQI